MLSPGGLVVQIICLCPPHLKQPGILFRYSDDPTRVSIPRRHQQSSQAGRTERFLRISASVSGSGEDKYSKILPGVEDVKKRRTVAGVDQEELLDPELLADPDSYFYNLNGIQMHHKISEDEELANQFSKVESHPKFPRLPMILLHGFASSVFSWGEVMKPLAQLTGSKVLAFDRPGFGLTSRVRPPGSLGKLTDATPLNPYSSVFSTLATLAFFDLLGAPKGILMGHSAGCVVAIDSYLEDPERIAALILISPAIVPPLNQPIASKKKKMNAWGNSSRSRGNSYDQESSNSRISNSVTNLFLRITRLAMLILKKIKAAVLSLYNNLLSAILRSTIAVMLIRIVIDMFGILTIRNAWFNASQVTDRTIQGYTKPLKAKGWEMALLENTLSTLTCSSSESNLPIRTKRLCEIKCPVLIITGGNDRIIPAWNAARLSSAIPGSSLEVINNCGHIPHEEKPEEFLHVVNNFLQKKTPQVETASTTISST